MSPQEAVVYIVQEPPVSHRDGVQISKDLTSAQRYGIIKCILTQQEIASRAPGPYYNKMLRELQDFNPDRDYICFAGGDPVALSLAVLALRNLNFREVKFLRWERDRPVNGDRTAGYYIPQILPLF